jgi:hypothetical protein
MAHVLNGVPWEPFGPFGPVASEDKDDMDICGRRPLLVGDTGCLNGLGGEHACAPMGTPVAILIGFGLALSRTPGPPSL